MYLKKYIFGKRSTHILVKLLTFLFSIFCVLIFEKKHTTLYTIRDSSMHNTCFIEHEILVKLEIVLCKKMFAIHWKIFTDIYDISLPKCVDSSCILSGLLTKLITIVHKPIATFTWTCMHSISVKYFRRLSYNRLRRTLINLQMLFNMLVSSNSFL